MQHKLILADLVLTYGIQYSMYEIKFKTPFRIVSIFNDTI